jgi:hypothetical protein
MERQEREDTRGSRSVSEDTIKVSEDTIIKVSHAGALFSWLERLPVTQEAAGSSPVAPAILIGTGNIGSHLCQENSFRASDRSNKTRATRGTRPSNRGKLC